MMRSVFTKTLYDRRWFTLGWSIAMLSMSMLITIFFPAMRPEGGFDSLLNNIPPAFQGLIGSLADMAHFDTYIASQVFDIRVPIIAGIMAIILALGLSTREEESGELRTYLSLPTSRSWLFIQKWLAMAVIMAVSVVALVLGVYLVAPFIEDSEIAFSHMANLALMTWVVMTTFGSVAFAAGMASGRRAVANFIGVVVIIGSFLLSTFAAAVDWLEPYEWLSLLHYFPAVDTVKNGLDWASISVLASVTLISLIISWLIFRRRDVA